MIAHWNEYFKEKGIAHIFFSALQEQTKLDNGELDAVSEENDSDHDDQEGADGDGEEVEGEVGPQMDIEELKQVEETYGGFKNELERQAREEKEA